MQQLILNQVRRERARQDAKWGRQQHPDVNHAGSSAMWGMLGIAEPDEAREICAMQNEHGQGVCWASILIEEVSEAIEQAAKGELNALRAELVQVAAVCVAWSEHIGERQAECEGGKPCQQAD